MGTYGAPFQASSFSMESFILEMKDRLFTVGEAFA